MNTGSDRGRTGRRTHEAALPPAAKDLIRSAALAHLVTIRRDGSPRVTLAWADVDGDEVVVATLFDQPKLADVRRDPRVCVSFEGGAKSGPGLQQYLVVYGRARVIEGGAPEVLARLAETYIGPGVPFPPMPDPPPGFLTRITVERIAGVGPWVERK